MLEDSLTLDAKYRTLLINKMSAYAKARSLEAK